ncbi:MAG: OmpA family protein, partial [Bradymonadaceae bacterium]
KDEDGCPDPDSDGDGVHDENDGCPNEPEDEDGYESDDGCPDTDNDGDALPDDVDDCPTKPGLKGNNGCPPEKDKASLNRDEGVIETSAPVEFQDDTATLKPSSKAVLRQVALIVRTHPDLGKIEVRAHTDNDGPADRNKKLSTKRADAVRTFLVQKGAVAADRVTAKGFGQERPLVPNSSESNRQKNERIEFMIVK